MPPTAPPCALYGEASRCVERFRLLVDGSDEVFFFEHDEAHRFTFLSPSVKAVVGLAPEQLIGRPYETILAGEGAERTAGLATHRALEQGAQQDTYHVAARHHDGTPLVLEIREAPLTGPDGSRSIHGFARDVTEKHAAEASLRRRLDSEAGLARISTFLNSPEEADLNEVLRIMGRVVDVSRAYIFMIREGGLVDNTHEWCAQGVASQMETLQGLSTDLFPWWMDELRRGTIRIPDVSALPVEAAREKEALEAQDVLSLLVVPLREADGSLLGFIGLDDIRSTRTWREEDVRVLGVAAEMVAADLQRRRSEERLRRREEYFRALIEDAPTLMMVLDENGVARYVSPSYEDILGYRPGELEGTPILEKVHPRDRAEVEGSLAGLVRVPGRSRSMEARIRHADGSWRVVGGTVKNLLHQPAVQGLVVNGQDVTERREAEQRLRLLSRAVDASPVSILITDPRGAIVYTNPRFTETTGYAAEEVVGGRCGILRSDRTEPDTYLDLWRTIRRGAEWHGELESRRKDGSVLREVVSVSPVRTDDGSVSHYVWVREDVTERRLLQAKFEQAQRMQMVGRLAGGVAHDINNVLTAIGGYASLIEEKLPEGHPIRSDVQEIARAKGRATAIMEQLLTFSRRDVAEMEVLDVNDVVRGIQSMLGRLIGEDVRLSTTLCSAGASVRADRTQLEQVLVNLAVNARDAMPGGGELKIGVERVRVEPDHGEGTGEGEWVILDVSDTGTGIPPEVRARLFEPFFTTKPSGKGLGLGLATVHGIVERGGGHLSVTSEVGRGTTFRVHLPAVAARPGRTVRPMGVPTRGHGLILLVEDDPTVRTVARRMLTGAGYEVVEAANGREALEWSEGDVRVPDLVLTDTVMPEVGGFELARRLREVRPGLEVLFMSGYTPEEARHDGDPPQDSHFLRKPFEPVDLLVRVGTLVKAGRRRDPTVPIQVASGDG